MNEPRRKRRWLIALAIVILFLIGGHEYDKRRFHSADGGFLYVTGMALPANVHAMAHQSETNDTLFHTTHYWLLQGPTASMLELAPPPHFARADPTDAEDVLRLARRSIAIGDEGKLIVGYEGSRDGGRDRWLLILTPGDRAIFVW